MKVKYFQVQNQIYEMNETNNFPNTNFKVKQYKFFYTESITDFGQGVVHK